MQRATLPFWYILALAAAGCSGDVRNEEGSLDGGSPLDAGGSCRSDRCGPTNADAGTSPEQWPDGGAGPETDGGDTSGGGTGSDAGGSWPDAGDGGAGGCDPRRTYRGNLDTDPGPYDDFDGDTNIDRLRGVSVITGFVRLGPSVTDLSALTCVTRITGYDDPLGPPHESGETRYGLELVNTALTRLEGLERLTSVGGLLISSNSALVSLQGLNHVSNVRVLEIRANQNLVSLDGLEGLIAIGDPELGGGLSINLNPALQTLHGLQNVTQIDGWLGILSNASLPNCQALAFRDRIGIGNIPGYIDIGANDDAGVCP